MTADPRNVAGAWFTREKLDYLENLQFSSADFCKILVRLLVHVLGVLGGVDFWCDLLLGAILGAVFAFGNFVRVWVHYSFHT